LGKRAYLCEAKAMLLRRKKILMEHLENLATWLERQRAHSESCRETLAGETQNAAYYRGRQAAFYEALQMVEAAIAYADQPTDAEVDASDAADYAAWAKQCRP